VLILAPVLFDLDGTLIESARGILTSMRAAFVELGCEPVCALEPSLIGPPLLPTLRKLLGIRSDGPSVNTLADAFKAHYDSEGYRESVVIEPMSQLLDSLAAQGRDLYIVTNKRITPTLLILEHIGWRQRFVGIYSLDSLTPVAINKTQVLNHVIAAHRLPADRCWYVGDRDEDAEAAAGAGLHCLRVPWGYGVGTTTTPYELFEFQQKLLQEP